MLLLAVVGALVGLRILRLLCPNPEWGDERVRVLFIGSSHVAGGIALERMPWPTGRLAHAGAEIDLLARSFFTHRRHWPNLEVVIIEVDEVTLLGDRVWNHRFNLTPLAGDLDLDPWELPTKDDPVPRGVWAMWNVARGRGLAALDPSRRLTLHNLERRFRSKPADWVWDRSPLPARAATSTLSRELTKRGIDHLLQTAADPKFNVESLVDLIRALRRERVEVILLTLPNHSIYRAMRPAEWQLLVEQTVRRARTDSQEPIQHWDYREDDRFSDHEFNNATHLNRRGAAYFTGLLAERLRLSLPSSFEGAEDGE